MDIVLYIVFTLFSYVIDRISLKGNKIHYSEMIETSPINYLKYLYK